MGDEQIKKEKREKVNQRGAEVENEDDDRDPSLESTENMRVVKDYIKAQSKNI